MSESILHQLNPQYANASEALFPHAPEGWTSADAEAQAAKESLSLDETHWQAIIGLQEFYAKHESIHTRELHDALNEKFHDEGGIRFLYQKLPQGPIAQGCRLAGLHAPSDSHSDSFGSVQ